MICILLPLSLSKFFLICKAKYSCSVCPGVGISVMRTSLFCNIPNE